jgi:RNA polymerase sigma-70 factor (ECF subfamily)
MNTNELSNEDIITGFKNGEEQAINYIYNTHFRPLCYFARGLINNKEEAEDIVVETFIKLLRKRNDFDELTGIKKFLYTVTRNACFDFLKHVQRKTASHKEIMHLMDKDEDFIQSRIIKAELLQLILNEVEQLPDIRKKIFKLIFVEGLTTAEIAETLDITVDTVRVQKSRALHSIRTAILKKGLLSLAGHFFGTLLFFFFFL